jgi:Tfp pilus assembly protein PilF
MTLTRAQVTQLTRAQEALEAEDFPAAISAFRGVWACHPADPGVAQLLANAHQLAGDALSARAVLRTAVARGGWEPPETAHALGGALLAVGDPREAVRCFAHVVHHRPHDPAGIGALATATRGAGDPGAAWSLIQRALRLAPSSPALLLTAAQIRHSLGDLTGAHHWLDRCEQVRPGHAPTRVQRAYTTLLQGASAAGWDAYESRPLPDPGTGARPWLGGPLDGGSILVVAEQGIGDLFQFLRFVPLLGDRGADQVLVEAPAGTAALLTASGFRTVPRGSRPATDWFVPLLSLPHRLGMDRDLLGHRVPYLAPPRDAAPPPLPAVPHGTSRLGITWAGNPAFANTHLRDLDPAWLPQLCLTAGVSWITLQQGDDARHAPAEFFPAPPPTSWGDTAHWLTSLDGLVTVDTGIAHLAGALGVRTWVLLPHDPDWRWGLGGTTTPWYPSVHLVRQPHPGDWDGALVALTREVAEWRNAR